MHNDNDSEYPFRCETALLLYSVLPYITPCYRHLLELIMKFLDFYETYKLYRLIQAEIKEFNENEAAPASLIERYVTDVEGLISALAKHSGKNLREITDMIKTLSNAKKLYDLYGVCSDLCEPSCSTQCEKDTQTDHDAPDDCDCPSEDSPQPDSEPCTTTRQHAPNITSLLGDMLNDEQKETLNLLKTLLE